ncbi:MAG: tyrosine-type recombinase/integrase [Clostridiaceae bacterium]|nr:tyrosine-type recombinase/integrase [Clostridiaceae bacterium]
MSQTIVNVVDGMIQQMQEYGIQESTVNQYYRGFCKPIIRFFNEMNGGLYSKSLLVEYKESARQRFEAGQFKERHFNAIKRCVRLLITFAETNHADFSLPKEHKKYKPFTENLEIIEQILATTTYESGFKYKLHCCMRHFFCFIEQAELTADEISDSTFFEFLNTVSETNKGSMDYILIAIRLISNFLKMERKISIKTDFSKLRLKYPLQRLISPYTEEEIKRLLSVIDNTSVIGKRDKAILMLAFDTGLRAIDITRLCLGDIDRLSGEIHIIQSKTKRPLSLPLHASVMNAVADYILEARPKSTLKEVFLTTLSPYKSLNGANSLDGVIEKYSKSADIKKKPYRSFHSLRRAFATELSAAEVPLSTISQMLGHTCINSDYPYLSYNKQQTSQCTIGFEKIPIVTGFYSDSYIPPLQNRSTITLEHLKTAIKKLPAMDFREVPLEGGAYA